ncbi:hypothetical protein H5410_002356 [Solanum commersonii]|uniref:Uncharacterized protein n=1 Tax=Solanum commersonii TaxID=4109 RepID=A0A9J6B2M1_SOLCO|nr:hypothetical protein H5410_002356 [Solanum commersonii]
MGVFNPLIASLAKLDIKRFESFHSLRQVLPSRLNDSVLDNWKKEKSKTTVKESTLDPEFNLCREKGSLKNTKREIGTKKRVDDRQTPTMQKYPIDRSMTHGVSSKMTHFHEQDYAWIRHGMLFPFMEHVDRLQGQTDLNDSTPADLRSAIEEAFLAENGVVEMLMVEINAAAGNLDHLRSLPRGVFEACDSNQDQRVCINLFPMNAPIKMMVAFSENYSLSGWMKPLLNTILSRLANFIQPQHNCLLNPHKIQPSSQGLLPSSVKSYSLSDDGTFEVICRSLVMWSLNIWFITLTSVNEIRVDLPSSGSIYFQVGFINKKLDIKQFETPRSCQDNAVEDHL